MDVTVRKPTNQEIITAEKWPVWEKEASRFNWQYTDKETCLIIEGEVIVTNEDGKEFYFKSGDLVIFPKNMKCVWDIKKNVRKYYNFG